MLKVIKKIPKSISLHLINKYTQFNYLFVFGWLGFIKYRLKKTIEIGIKYSMLRVQGKKVLFYTYLKLIENFYSWTTRINKKVLLLHGVGYKYRLLKNKLFLVLGYSHIVQLWLCKNIRLVLINNKTIKLFAINLYILNSYVYKIKSYKKLDVYKGKGILLGGELVIKKEGKKATF